MEDKREPLLSQWGWPFARKKVGKRTRNTRNNDWPNIFDEANETLLASVMIYALVDLRTLARQGLLTSGEGDSDLVDRILSLPVSTREIVRLVSQNRDVILQQIGESSTDLYLSAFDLVDDAIAQLEVCPETGETTLVSSSIVVCDDEHSDTELVYGIWINSARERITVTFRGCTTTKDWSIAAHPFLKEISNPAFDPSEASCPKTVQIHYGFYHYLNAVTEHTGKTKIETIMSHIRNLLETQCRGYTVYFTGHSLGGALAAIFAFQAAACDEIPKPVSCITFASPMVGNLAFRRAFQSLERKGYLRCLRVTNSLDMFTKLPDRASSSFLLPLCFGASPIHYVGLSCLFFACFQNNMYRHVGMGLKLYRHGQYKIKFPTEPDNYFLLVARDWKKHLEKPIQLLTTIPFACCCCDCLDYGCCCRIEDFGINHQAAEYLNRLQPLSYELREHYLDDLYDEQTK